MNLMDIPFVVALGEWVWGGDPSPEVSAEICLDILPFLSSGCISRLMVKGIGIAIILGASLNKAPVFFNVLSTKSVAGLSISSVYAETIMYANAAFYGMLMEYPFTAYAENGGVCAQSIMVALLVWQYKDDPTVTMPQKMMASVAFGTYLWAVLIMLPQDMYHLLLTLNWPVLLYARGIQIIANFQLQHTGAQSAITLTMNLVGSLIRILTTIKEVGWDMTMISGYILSAGLNIMLITQYFYYKENTKKFTAKLSEKKTD
eukprot:scaffold421190_cov50-Attheya_sp.AAC.4